MNATGYGVKMGGGGKKGAVDRVKSAKDIENGKQIGGKRVKMGIMTGIGVKMGEIG